jgi:hypothetical protein
MLLARELDVRPRRRPPSDFTPVVMASNVRGGTSLAPSRVGLTRNRVVEKGRGKMHRIVTVALSLGVGIVTLGACSHMPFNQTTSSETTRCPAVASSGRPTFDQDTPASPSGSGIYAAPDATVPSNSGSVASAPPMSGSSNMPSAASPGQGIGSASAPVPGSGSPASATSASSPTHC